MRLVEQVNCGYSMQSLSKIIMISYGHLLLNQRPSLCSKKPNGPNNPAQLTTNIVRTHYDQAAETLRFRHTFIYSLDLPLSNARLEQQNYSSISGVYESFVMNAETLMGFASYLTKGYVNKSRVYDQTLLKNHVHKSQVHDQASKQDKKRKV